jgi:hypothetical protein
MSRKSKLILATAVFGAALFGASCGGGGGTASAPPSPPPSPPPPGIDGQVLALLDVGTASAGTLNPVTICQLKSDNKAYCGNDLNPSANVDLHYGYEFGNGNVLLVDAGGIGYFFNGSQVIKLDKYRPLGASSSTPETTAPGGITIPDPYASGTNVYVTPNFAILLTNSGKDLVVVTSSGKVIKDSDSTAMTVNAGCETVTKGVTTYKLNTDGTSSSTTIPTTLASAGGKYLVLDTSTSSNRIYLSDSGCSATGVLVDTISGVNDAQMVKVGNDFYIAVRAGTNLLRYYKVSGSTPTPLNTGITLAGTPNKYYYALDGNGYLYAITTATDTVSAYRPTDGASAGSATVTSANFTGLLALADRVLAKDASASKAHEITTTGSVVNAVDKGGGTLYTALDGCTDANNTKAIDGVRTNFIRCLYDNSTEVLYSLAYNSGNYQGASYNLPGGSEVAQALFGAGKVLVRPGGSSTILLCNTTTTPTISCSATDLPDITTSIKNYLKVNGLDVFYTNSGGALKVGNVFDPPSALPIIVSSPSGGNASLDLNKFAFSFRPAGAPCATQIVYFSSRTASPKTYTIAQPSNGCVTRILKVFP